MPFLIVVAALLAGVLFVTRARAATAPSSEVIPMPGNQTRGERNNNPGNIRVGNAWQGERAQATDPDFEEFESPEAGIRALALVLLNYQSRHGLRTVRDIIARYAPTNENDTEAYINSVASEMGVTPNAQINLTDKTTLAHFVRAVIRHENGRVVYADSEIAFAIARL